MSAQPLDDKPVTLTRLAEMRAAGDEDELFLAVGLGDAHRTGLDARDQWGVARIDAQFAGLTGQCHERGLAREDRLLGADHVDMNGIGHAFIPRCTPAATPACLARFPVPRVAEQTMSVPPWSGPGPATGGVPPLAGRR